MNNSYKKLLALVLAGVLSVSALTAAAAKNGFFNSNGETPITDKVNTIDTADKADPTATDDKPAPTDPTATDDKPAPTDPTATDDKPAPTDPKATDDQPKPEDPKPTEPKYTLGDVTGGGIGVDDALFILRASVKLEKYESDEQKAAADIDGDGNVTSADALIALRISVKLEDIKDYIK